MQQKKSIGFGFRGWMLILYQAIAYLTFQCFTQYPLNILADFYGGSQKVANIYSICAVVGILVQIVLAGIVARMKKIRLFGTILGAVTLVLAFLVMTLPAGAGWDVCYAIINVVSVLYATFALGILVGQWFPTRKGVVMGIATLAFIIAVIVNARIYIVTTSLFRFVSVLILIFGGAGLMVRYVVKK